jgi:uncharacterized protein
MMSENWIATYTDRHVDPLDPFNSQFCIEDIAHALALVNRVGGHTKEPYSVGDHSLRVMELVAEMGGSVVGQMGALLHDSPEAYISDFPRPVKDLVRYRVTVEGFPHFRSVEVIESDLLTAIFKQLDLPWPNGDDWRLVELADNQMLATEARDLMHGTQNWLISPGEPLNTRINPVCWWGVEAMFLQEFENLSRIIKGANV